jgi:hypothetical protein
MNSAREARVLEALSGNPIIRLLEKLEELLGSGIQIVGLLVLVFLFFSALMRIPLASFISFAPIDLSSSP